MNVTALLLLTSLTAGPSEAPPTEIYQLSHVLQRAVGGELVIRGQDPNFGSGQSPTPTYGEPTLGQPTFSDPIPGDGFYNEPGTTIYSDPNTPLGSQYIQPGVTNDPWVNPAAPGLYDGFGSGGLYTYGINGPQPYQLGWTSRYDAAILPKEGTSIGSGFAVTEFNVEKEYVSSIANNWIFSIAPQYNLRLWEGPTLNPGLPADVHRFGLGLKLATPVTAGWSGEVGFNPAIASDLNNSLTSDAWQFDAHGVLFWRWSPRWMWALGVAYWDRVDDIVIPYAGAVWTPSDYFELRLLFPKARADVFLGTPWGMPTWAYVSGEYHVESYQVDLDPGGPTTAIELEDWRVVGGLRWEWSAATGFLEAGWVFDREVEFDLPAAGFDIDSGFIGRAGLRY